MQHEIDAYLARCEQQQRLCPASITVYRKDLEQLAALLRHHGLTTWSGLDAVLLQRAWARQQVRPLNTQRRWLSISRGFFAYLQAQGQLTTDPSAGLKSMPLAAEAPAALGFVAARDRALLALSWLAAWTARDLIALPLAALALEENPPCVRLPATAYVLTPEAVSALRAWLDWRLACVTEASLLFVDRHGEALNLCATQQRLRRLRQRQYLHNALTTPIPAEPFNQYAVSGSLDFKALAYVYARAHPRARRAALPTASTDDDSDF